MNDINVKEVIKTFHGKTVFSGSAKFKAGKLYGLLGPNGSGKSTLLKIIAGVERPDSGSVLFGGKNEWQTHCPQVARDMVLVPDRKGLFHDTVLNNVLFGLKVRRLARRERLDRGHDALTKVGLSHLCKQNSLGLSNGEAQRLCLAMAMAINPQIILLDEPTSSLDPSATAVVEELIDDLKQPNRLIILVSHDLPQAKRLTDEVILLIQGEVAEQGNSGQFFTGSCEGVSRRFLAGDPPPKLWTVS